MVTSNFSKLKAPPSAIVDEDNNYSIKQMNAPADSRTSLIQMEDSDTTPDTKINDNDHLQAEGNDVAKRGYDLETMKPGVAPAVAAAAAAAQHQGESIAAISSVRPSTRELGYENLSVHRSESSTRPSSGSKRRLRPSALSDFGDTRKSNPIQPHNAGLQKDDSESSSTHLLRGPQPPLLSRNVTSSQQHKTSDTSHAAAEDVEIEYSSFISNDPPDGATKTHALRRRSSRVSQSGSHRSMGESDHQYRTKSEGRSASGGENSHAEDQNDDLHHQTEADQNVDGGSKLWRARLRSGRLVNHEKVQIAIIGLIVINALMMGIATMDWVTDNPNIENVFVKIDQVFLGIFTVEVAMQFFYIGLALFQDAWLVFDLSIVVLSWSFETLQVVRAFRIFRAFRLVTRIKPLRDLVLAIGAVLPRMYAITALLLIIFYVFAVLFTELFSDLPLSENYFQTLDASLFTCMEMMTLEWAAIAREVIEYKPWAWAPFLCFIAISGFIVYNLIVAVVVEAVAVTEQTVRALDGIEPDSPTAKLEEAEERLDMLRYHVDDMMRTQGQIQSMLEVLAGEMMNLETERMRAEEREKLFRTEMNRRNEYQKKMESTRQIMSLERNYVKERERRGAQRQERMLQRENSKDHSIARDGMSIGESQRSNHSEEPSSPVNRSRRSARGSLSDRSPKRSAATSSGGVSGSGSNRSMNTKSVSSKSVGSSLDESGGRGWKLLVDLQPQDA